MSQPGSLHFDARTSSATVPPSAGSVDGLHFIDTITQQFNLNAVHRSHLQGLYQVGTSVDGKLSSADILSRVYMLACQFSGEIRLANAIHSSGGSSGSSGEELKPILDELAIRLDDTFHLTSEQTKNIRQACQECIYKPMRVSYKSLHIDLDRVLRVRAKQYRLDNVFGKPAREAKCASDGKRIASSVRNAFRQDIRNSVIGLNQTSLEKFTYDCIQAYLARSAILHRFAFENRGTLGESSDSDNNIADTTDTTPDSLGKRKRPPPPPPLPRGRIPDGEDFWSRVDAWFKSEIKTRGKEFTSEPWKT
ncbi:hypothetical protein BJ912DRAFT_929295 [Pholiota molesta]|nr:hypothetical protein BJ912DRAFT_929295 [Pholiota molesta]